MKKYLLRLPDDMHKTLKHRSIEENTNIKELILKALDKDLKKYILKDLIV